MGASGEPVGVTRSIVILGAGIVGSALAAYLCEQGGLMVTVLEAGPPERLIGSTGHAPGYFGVFNEVSVATELARASAEKYEQIRYGGRAGFDRVGGLEVATTPGGMADLERRATLAVEAGVPVRVLAPEQAASAAPALVDPRRCTGGLLYPHDGTTRADVITAALRERAVESGARFVYAARDRDRDPCRPRHRRKDRHSGVPGRRRGRRVWDLGAGCPRRGRSNPAAHPGCPSQCVRAGTRQVAGELRVRTVARTPRVRPRPR